MARYLALLRAINVGGHTVKMDRLRALDSSIDLDALRDSLAMIPAVCAGGPAAGPIGALPPRGRFRWLVSPRSTIIQMSPVHTGRTKDPRAALEHLVETMVRRPGQTDDGVDDAGARRRGGPSPAAGE